MPIYEYYCTTCDYKAERICSYDDRNNFPICVDCMLPMKRSVSQVGRPQFRGTGFHITDYPKKNK